MTPGRTPSNLAASDVRFAGVDARKRVIEASVRPTGELWTVETCEKGMTEITEKLSRVEPELVVMQANGNLELPLAGLLATFGLPFALVQPWNIREFAKAIGRRPEQRQAELLAYFAELVRPQAWHLSAEVVQRLKDLRIRRHEIQEMLALEHGRLDSAPPVLQKDLQRHIQYLQKDLSSIDEQFSGTVRIRRNS